MSTTSLERFFQETFPVIRRKCARMLGDGEEAADIAQETFLRLCESPLVHEPPAARLAWIYRTSTNLAIDRLRRKRLRIEVRAVPGHDVAAPAALPEAALAARQHLQAVAATLAEDELAALIMTRFDDMTQDEVAAVLQISPRTVRRLLTKAQAALDQVLAAGQGPAAERRAAGDD